MQLIGHDHRTAQLEHCAQFLGGLDMVGLSDCAPRGPPARADSCPVALAGNAHVIQIRGDIYATTTEPWIHRVFIRSRAHVVVPAQPDTLPCADQRCGRWQWCRRRPICLDHINRASVNSAHVVGIRDREAYG